VLEMIIVKVRLGLWACAEGLSDGSTYLDRGQGFVDIEMSQ